MSLQNDGVLAVDVANPAAPAPVKLLRTLGYASHVDFSADDIYVAAGNFGVFHGTLSAAGDLPQE